MKKVIVTGATGFIGSHIVKHLQKDVLDNYKVIGFDRNDRDIGIELYTQDLCDKLPEIEDVYAVIHLAARAGVRDSREKFDEYVKDNIIATQRIIEKCISSWKPSIFIFASSSSVYDNMSPYSFTKEACESLIRSYINNGLLDNTKCICMRIFTAYGPNQRKGLAMSNFIDKVLEDEPITIFGDGFQSRDFVYIDDLCYIVKDMLRCPGAYPLIHPIGHGESHNLYEVINIIGEVTGKQVKINYEPKNRYDSPKTQSPDPTILFECKTPLREGLTKQIKKQMEKKNGRN